MHPNDLIRQLERHTPIYSAMFNGLNNEEIRWKPAPEKWCLLEVICHLHDEEREDFRARVKHTLETPDSPLPSIDPTGWVTSRSYMEQDFQEMKEKFLAERRSSIEWLRALKDPDWSSACQHPKFGPMSAELFLHNWVAHDLLHFRQITGLRFGYLKANSAVPLDYAGTW